ncbi:MAG: hypothetical protein ACJ71G_13585, partial [Nitrososphaeraceae archaeon]
WWGNTTFPTAMMRMAWDSTIIPLDSNHWICISPRNWRPYISYATSSRWAIPISHQQMSR